MFIKKVNTKCYFSSDKKNCKLNKILLSSEWQRLKNHVDRMCANGNSHMVLIVV